MLCSLPPYAVYLSPEAPLNRLWQTDMRDIWRLSDSQTAMTSYPALAPHSGRIKASVAFTGGETSKDYFAWSDNLVTTGVYVVLKCVCDAMASKIGSEREFMLVVLARSHFPLAVSPLWLWLHKSAFEGRGRHLPGAFTFQSGCRLHHANISYWIHFQSSMTSLLYCWITFVP